MEITVRIKCIGLGLMLCAAMIGSARASQQPGHTYLALAIKDQLPQQFKKVVNENLDAYLMGVAGPDIAYTTHYVQVAAGVFAPGTESHGDEPGRKSKSGDLVVNLLNLAKQRGSDLELAFAIGWLTHYCVDNLIHPLVNNHGGFYPIAEEQLRHKHLEMLECEHVFQKADPKTHHLYPVKLGSFNRNVPAELVSAAFAKTFPTGGNSKAYKETVKLIPQYGHEPIEERQPAPFVAAFTSSADNMRILSESMLAVHQKKSYGVWGKAEFMLAVKGPPPTPDEYEKLMNPLSIDNVTLEKIPETGPDDPQGFLVIDYTVNDLRLMKLFCDDWDKVNVHAAQYSLDCINKWAANPSGFKLPNLDLNVGLVPYDREKAKPGKIDLNALVAIVSMSGSNGGNVTLFGPEHYPAFYKEWQSRGEWVWCPIADGASQSMIHKWARVTGLRSTFSERIADDVTGKNKIWKGKAGQAYLKVPFEPNNLGLYDVTVRLVCRNFDTDEDYGVEASWSGELGSKLERRKSVIERMNCGRVDAYGDFTWKITKRNENYKSERKAVAGQERWSVKIGEFEATGKWKAGKWISEEGSQEIKIQTCAGEVQVKGTISETQYGYSAKGTLNYGYDREEWLSWGATSVIWDKDLKWHNSNQPASGKRGAFPYWTDDAAKVWNTD